MGRGGALAEHSVGPLRHVLNLDTWHSAIMAPTAPKYNPS
jgi:hypothetical protein